MSDSLLDIIDKLLSVRHLVRAASIVAAEVTAPDLDGNAIATLLARH